MGITLKNPIDECNKIALDINGYLKDYHPGELLHEGNIEYSPPPELQEAYEVICIIDANSNGLEVLKSLDRAKSSLQNSLDAGKAVTPLEIHKILKEISDLRKEVALH